MSKFAVPEMSCGHCTSAIENEIKAIDPDATIDCNLNNRTVTVSGKLDETTLLATIKEAGYDAMPA